MSHVADTAHMIAGPLRRVVAATEMFIPKRPLAAPGSSHFAAAQGGPLGDVTNEDYIASLVQFANGAHGVLEACRVFPGPKCQMAFEVHGTRGSLSWDFERMNELKVFLPDGDVAKDGYTLVQTGPAFPFHGNFNPSPATSLGYDDLKVIESYQFLKSVAEERQGEPGFREALAVAEVQEAILRSCRTEAWEPVGRRA